MAMSKTESTVNLPNYESQFISSTGEVYRLVPFEKINIMQETLSPYQRAVIELDHENHYSPDGLVFKTNYNEANDTFKKSYSIKLKNL